MFSALTGFGWRCYRIVTFSVRQVFVIMVILAMTARMGKSLFTSQGKEVFFWRIARNTLARGVYEIR
jgi:hypothetical protein